MGRDVRVGISGWNYPSWRGDFYPAGLAHARELAYVAERMRSVELNGSFYSLQRPTSYQRWRDAVPEEFVFAIKGSRYITHMLRLRDVDQALANFFASGVLTLGAKLGPVLWQLPEREEFDAEVLDDFLSRLPVSTGAALELARRHDARVEGRAWLEIDEDRPLRHALEPRARSFDSPALAPLLRERDVALVAADSAGAWPGFGEQTASFAYARLHGSTDLYASGYSDAELDVWAERIAGWSGDAYVYFDNDARGRAPHDALALASRVQRAGAAQARE